MQDLFEDIDTDHSGGVSLEELTAGLTKLGYKLTPNEIEQLVRNKQAIQILTEDPPAKTTDC